MYQLVSSALGSYSHHLYLAKGSSSSTIGGDAIIAVLAAVLGFASAYAINQIQRRQEPRKQLSWALQTEHAQLQVSTEIEKRVSVLYRDTRVKNLTAATYVISNTGNRAVMNERIRFNFGDQADVLEHSPYPAPEPELRVVQVDDHGLSNLDFVYSVGQLEVGEQVKFLFVLQSLHSITPPGPHATNPDGNVPFIRRGTERTVADQEHLRPFFIGLLAFIALPLILGPILATFIYPFDDAALTALRLILLIPLLPHVIPVARLAEQLVVHYLSPDRSTRSATNAIYGGEFTGPVLQADRFSDVSFSLPEQSPAEDDTAAG
jgi:hypothetical protein